MKPPFQPHRAGLSISIHLLEDEHLAHLQALVNAHVDAAVPGWALPATHLRERLNRNPDQYVTDPWVRERLTLCALERGRLVAATHLLRYGVGPAVGPDYHNAGDLAWFLFWPDSPDAGHQLLAAAHEQMAAWAVSRVYAWDAGLPVAFLNGVPDVWPHIAATLSVAHHQPDPDRREAVYGGWLVQIPPPGAAPLPNLTVQRTLGRRATRFTALADGQPVGHCECAADLTQGGAIPALGGWAELAELQVAEGWRSRGIGAWLVRHAVAWLRLGGCERVLLSVAADDEARGAGRFYQRLGWTALLRCQRAWSRA